jgi:DNA-binding transcriptional regulator YdaS (Cro superfamily)
MSTGIEALREAIQILGSQSATARVVGVKQPSVNWMARHGRKVPAEWCIPLEQATQGHVTRHQLRPDLYPTNDTQAAE